MAPLWGVTKRAAAVAVRHIRLLPSCSAPESGIRTLSCSSRALSKILTSPFPDVAQPSGNVINTIFEHVGRWGSKTAVECTETGKSYTYNQMLESISKWAGFLTSLGLTKGDVIAIHLPNCPEYPIVLYGALSIGVVVTTVNCNYTAEEITRQLVDSKAQLVVGTPSLEAPLLGSIGMHKGPLHLVMIGPSKVPGSLNLQEILKDPAIPYADTVNVANKDIAIMPYSSGTTGLPKGVVVSHGALSVNINQFIHPSFFTTPFATDEFQGSYMGLLPFYHIYGLLVILSIGFHAGVKVAPLAFFEPNSYIQTLKKIKVTQLHLVPPILNLLTKSPAATKDTLSSVNSILVGAAPVSPSTAKEFKKKFGEHIIFQEGYGMTEMLITNVMPNNNERIGTCGQLLPNVSAKIIDTATGEDLPPSETGELCYKSPALMNGYFQNEAATSTTIDVEGWLHTGDVGFFDNEGFLKIVDRTKELIKVKGLQVSPSELEDVLRQHPDIMDVGVVGCPHDRFGEAPRAFIVTKRDLSSDDVHSFLEDKIAPHKKLAGGVAFVKELPKTATGKLLRRELKKIAIE